MPEAWRVPRRVVVDPGPLRIDDPGLKRVAHRLEGSRVELAPASASECYCLIT